LWQPSPAAAAFRACSGRQQDFDEFIKASGGSRALRKLLTVSFGAPLLTKAMKNRGLIPLPQVPQSLTIRKSPSTPTEIFAYNGKSAWRETSVGELGTLTGPEAVELEAAAQLSNSHFLNRNNQKRQRSSRVRSS